MSSEKSIHPPLATLLLTTYDQDLWEISANVNNYCRLSTTHFFTNSSPTKLSTTEVGFSRWLIALDWAGSIHTYIVWAENGKKKIDMRNRNCNDMSTSYLIACISLLYKRPFIIPFIQVTGLWNWFQHTGIFRFTLLMWGHIKKPRKATTT